MCMVIQEDWLDLLHLKKIAFRMGMRDRDWRPRKLHKHRLWICLFEIKKFELWSADSLLKPKPCITSRRFKSFHINQLTEIRFIPKLLKTRTPYFRGETFPGALTRVRKARWRRVRPLFRVFVYRWHPPPIRVPWAHNKGIDTVYLNTVSILSRTFVKDSACFNLGPRCWWWRENVKLMAKGNHPNFVGRGRGMDEQRRFVCTLRGTRSIKGEKSTPRIQNLEAQVGVTRSEQVVSSINKREMTEIWQMSHREN